MTTYLYYQRDRFIQAVLSARANSNTKATVAVAHVLNNGQMADKNWSELTLTAVTIHEDKEIKLEARCGLFPVAAYPAYLKSSITQTTLTNAKDHLMFLRLNLHKTCNLIVQETADSLLPKSATGTD